MRFSKHLLRIDTRHVLGRINHVGHQDTQLVILGIVEDFVEDGSEISKARVTDSFGGLEDVAVFHKLVEPFWISVYRVIYHINLMIRIVSWQIVQHLNNGCLERTITGWRVVGNHRTRTLKIKIHFERLNRHAREVDFLGITAMIEKFFNVFAHLICVKFSPIIELWEVCFLSIQIVFEGHPVIVVDGVICSRQLHEQMIQIFFGSVATTTRKEGDEDQSD